MLAEVLRRASTLIGKPEVAWLGSVSVRDFCHYASASGDDDYVRMAVARERAHLPVRAPDLFASGMFSYDYGPPESELNDSGMSARESPCTNGLDLFQVHGGARVTLHNPLYSGTVLHSRRTMTDASRKTGRSGDFVVLEWTTEIGTDLGQPVCTVSESLIVREIN